MSGLKLKVSDFESFLNKIGLKLGDSYNDFEFNALTDNLLNSNKMFEIILSNEKQHSLVKVKINERELFFNDTDISKLWRKHLYNIYGQEYYDYLKNYCEKNKNFYRQLHEENIQEVENKIGNLSKEISKLVQERQFRINKLNETEKKYDAILNDLEENLEM